MSYTQYFSILPFIWEIGKITSSSICDVIIFIKSATIPVIVMITLEDITSTSVEIITKLSRKIYHVNRISHSHIILFITTSIYLQCQRCYKYCQWRYVAHRSDCHRKVVIIIMLYMLSTSHFTSTILSIASTINTQSHFLIGVYYQHFSNIRVFMHLLVIFYGVTCIPVFMRHTLIRNVPVNNISTSLLNTSQR